MDVVPPPVAPRNLTGWVAMWTIILGLISLSLSAYLSPSPAGRLHDRTLDQALKQAIIANELSKGQSDSPLGKESLADLAAALAPNRAKDAKAMRYYAAVRFEQGKDLDSKDIGLLKQSPEEFDHALAKIYSAKTVSKEDVADLAKPLNDDFFLAKVANNHLQIKAGKSPRKNDLVSESEAVALGGVSVALFVAMITGLVLWALYSSRKPPLEGMPLKWITLADADMLALRAAQLLLVYVALGLLPLPKPYRELFSGLGLAGFAFLSLRMPLPSGKMNAAQFGISKENLGRNILWGIGGALANVPVLMIAMMISTSLFSGLPDPEHPLTTQLAKDSSFPAVLLALFMASIFAPIFEEILFRGHVFPAITKVTKSLPLGIIASSLVFAAMHPTGIPAWLPLASLGAVSCWLTVQTGSLVPSIVMHAVHNLAILGLSLTIGFLN